MNFAEFESLEHITRHVIRPVTEVEKRNMLKRRQHGNTLPAIVGLVDPPVHPRLSGIVVGSWQVDRSFRCVGQRHRRDQTSLNHRMVG